MRLIGKTAQVTSRVEMPLAVGFGVSKPGHVRAIVTSGADAAIVGSGFVNIIKERHKEKEEMFTALEEYASELKKATIKTEET